MANRFLETNYFKSPYVRSLKGALKTLYSFIICDCTPAGIWALDLEAASLYIGFTVTFAEFDEFFVKKKKAIDLGKGRYLFPDFIEHQYPSGLQESNTAHKNIIRELQKLNLLNEKLEISIRKDKGALEGLQSPSNRSQGYILGNGNGNKGGLGDFCQKTKPEDVNGIPEQNIKAIIEQMKITQQTDINKKQVEGMWEVFKLQKLTGHKFYQDISAVYDYFQNWIKTQKFTNGNHRAGPIEAPPNYATDEMLAKYDLPKSKKQ